MRFPGNQDRTAILGRTGTGKTTAGMWHLSGKNFHAQPWVIVNTKDDEFINEIAQISGVKTITVNDTPGETGLHIVNPAPDQETELDAFFKRIWEKQNCGVFVDEGYMIEEDKWFNHMLTQGRSRKLPMFVCSQRPAWLSRFVFTEAQFIQVFDLNHLKDRKNVAEFTAMDPHQRLPGHCSLWYDVGQNTILKLSPVPDRTKILNSFKAFFAEAAPQAVDAPEGSASPEKMSERRLRTV